MQLTAPYRCEAISKAFRSIPLLGLIGTGKIERTEVGHTRARFPHHTAIHFGYQKNSDLTNKSAGRSLFFGQPFSERSIHSIEVPPPSLRGRGAAITLHLGGTRLKVILAYFPPRP